MTDINQLLNKYYTREGKNRTAYEKRNKAEHTSNEYRNKQMHSARTKHKHQILNELLTEINFQITPNQIQQIRYWIDKYDLKNLHRQTTDETIILALILIQYKQNNPKIDIGTMKISKKYDLNNHKFTIIQNRLIFQIMKTTPLIYSQAKYVNHNLL